jgi:hypothetical protein
MACLAVHCSVPQRMVPGAVSGQIRLGVLWWLAVVWPHGPGTRPGQETWQRRDSETPTKTESEVRRSSLVSAQETTEAEPPQKRL